MLIQILLLIGLALVAGYFWQASKNTKQKPQLASKKSSKASNAKPRPTHRCVVIEPGLTPCKAIQAYAGQKILMDKAPTLPVQGCDVKRCECRFLRYDDRRMGPRRYSKMKAANQIISENNINKRSRKDRRNN